MTTSSPPSQETKKSSRSKRPTMLLPIAYSESAMPSLRLARSSRNCRRVAKVLFLGLVVALVFMAIAPWQQSVTGSGSVIAYDPEQRQQVIESPIKGRITRWGDDIYENAVVKQGQMIVEISDLDESYAQRLQSQLLNSQQVVTSARQQVEANQRALASGNLIVQSYAAQVQAYGRVKEQTISAQNAFVEMARKKVMAEQQQLVEYEAAIPQLEAEYDRLKTLEEEGNIALQKVQEVERKLNEAKAKVLQAKAYVDAAKSELEGKLQERSAKIEKAQVDIDYAEAALSKAKADVSKAESDIAKSEQELQKAEKEVLEMEVKISRQQNQTITAPFDGFLVQISPNLGTKVLKEGDPLCTIVPQTSDRAVQIWLDGNDAPLVEPGRHVRLQFEGWPAIQFSGWPSVAVGTFGGEVVSVDSIDNGMGKFRALIRPDVSEQEWPEDRFLRQGVRANGWVLLEQVPLWYEVWRRLNGFPPVVTMEDKSDQKGNKPPKLPK